MAAYIPGAGGRFAGARMFFGIDLRAACYARGAYGLFPACSLSGSDWTGER